MSKIKQVISAKVGSITVRLESGAVVLRSGGTVSWRTNNPGNLKHGPFAKLHGAIGKDHKGHAVFPDIVSGRKAKYQLLFGPERGYLTMSLVEALQRYAPVSDGNDPISYANFVARKSKINVNDVLGSMTEAQRERVLIAMATFEGFKEGTVTDVAKSSD